MKFKVDKSYIVEGAETNADAVLEVLPHADLSGSVHSTMFKYTRRRTIAVNDIADGVKQVIICNN